MKEEKSIFPFTNPNNGWENKVWESQEVFGIASWIEGEEERTTCSTTINDEGDERITTHMKEFDFSGLTTFV